MAGKKWIEDDHVATLTKDTQGSSGDFGVGVDFCFIRPCIHTLRTDISILCPLHSMNFLFLINLFILHKIMNMY